MLGEFYPNAPDAFPVLTHHAALEVLRRAPNPAHAAKLTLKGLVALLTRSGRGNRAGLAETVVAPLHQPCLRQPPRVEAALGVAVAGLVAIIEATGDAIAELEAAMTAEFDCHPKAKLLRGVPGLDPILAARVLAEVGDDPSRFATTDGLRAFAGTAPITRASGRSKIVRTRHVHNKRLADPCHWWAFASITKSAGARIHYDNRRAARDSHNAALRNLANKLLGRL